MAKKYLDENGLLYFWGKLKGYFQAKEAGKGLSTNDLTATLKTNYDAAYTHSQATHAPADAEKNVNADWNSASGDSQILNKPTIPDQLSDLSDDATHRLVTDTEKSTWNGKQAALGFTPVPDTRKVAGKTLTADITLAKADVGLGNVDNTSDANKPVSTAQATAIGLKLDTSAYTANDVLTKVKTVDGTGSGLDADLLDGKHSSDFILASAKGAANGIASLDANGLIPSTQLPSFVDDVIELVGILATAPATCATGDHYFNTTDAKFYTATGPNTWGTGADPARDVIYVDISSDISYRWGGSTMVQITSSDVVAITNGEIDTVVAS